MAFTMTLGRKQLESSKNGYLAKLFQESGNQRIALNSSQEDVGSGDAPPAVIRDFAQNSLLIQESAFLDLLEQDFSGYKAWYFTNPDADAQTAYLEDNASKILSILKSKYESSKLKMIDANDQLPWVKQAKQMMEGIETSEDQQKLLTNWRELYALLALGSIIEKNYPDDLQYSESLKKITRNYSQPIKSFISDLYNSLSSDEVAYQLRLGKETTNIRLLPEGKIFVEFEAESSMPQPLGRASVDSLLNQNGDIDNGVENLVGDRVLLPLSVKFELDSDYASVSEIKTEDSIHYFVVAGFKRSKNFDLDAYLAGGDALPLRLAIERGILLANCRHAQDELLSVLKSEADPNDLYSGLKKDLHPLAKKLTSEVNRLVFEADKPDNQDIEALTTHLKALKLCFDARDPGALVKHYEEFLASSNKLKEMQDDPNQKKSFGVSHRFAKVLEYGLPILGAFVFIIGVALAATGIGLAVGSGIALGGAMLILISGNLKFPRESEVSHLNDKALNFFTPHLPKAAREDARPESDEDRASRLRESP